MSNIVTYIVELQDKFSAKLQKLSGSSSKLQKNFAEVTRISNLTNTGLRTLSLSASDLREKIAELRRQSELIPVGEVTKIRRYNSEIKRLEGQLNRLSTITSGNGFTSKISEAFAGLPGAGFITNPVVAMGAGIGKSIQLGMENELQKQNITTLVGGDTATAEDLFLTRLM